MPILQGVGAVYRAPIRRGLLLSLYLTLFLVACGAPVAEVAPTQSALVVATNTLPTIVPPTAVPLAPTTNLPTVAPSTPTSSNFIKKIDVGGYSLHIVCLGTGGPTVVLDAGLGADSSVWNSVMLKVSKFTRVCGYDRAGLGESDPAPKKTRTSQDMVKDLHVLLTNTSTSAPYVLVGWSLAGFNVRLYASQYPQEVVGMVLVEASHPDQNSRDLASLPPESPQESTGLKDFRHFLTTEAKDPTQNPEGWDFEASAAQVRTTGSLGAIPLVVLTAGKSDPPPDLPPDLAEKLVQNHLALQEEQVGLSSNSTHTISKFSSHCVPCDDPSAVSDAIQKVVDEVNKK